MKTTHIQRSNIDSTVHIKMIISMEFKYQPVHLFIFRVAAVPYQHIIPVFELAPESQSCGDFGLLLVGCLGACGCECGASS